MSTYKTENSPSNPDAIPLYNDNFFKVWNWFDTVWSCDDWMTWHKSMKAKYGKTAADTTFLKHWNDLATGSSAIDCRSFNTTFRGYMTTEKLLDSLYSGVGVIAKPIGTATDVVTSVSSGISGASKGLESVGKILKVALPIVMVVAIAYAGYWGYKHFGKAKQPAVGT